MDFTAPHFLLFLSTEDPFNGVVERLFEYGDYPFERVYVEPTSDIKSLGVPLGRLPAMQVDGVTLAGFSIICRAIATRIGLDGSSLKESSEIDMIVGFIEEEQDRLRPVMQDGVSTEKVDVEIESFLQNLAPFLNARFKSGPNRLVGENLTWGDFVLVNFLRSLIAFAGDSILLDYPNLSGYWQQNKDL
ncbi:hypothetical protein M3Y98_00406500 [Aphelenchoides besseyi]|nr:hypothetical protein M3Y98_00406500 [Aphelenchoides besseyi]KAI6201996.1 hypothetical protein M3Y96_00901500 [Aphelenchoides besseyi]